MFYSAPDYITENCDLRISVYISIPSFFLYAYIKLGKKRGLYNSWFKPSMYYRLCLDVVSRAGALSNYMGGFL